MALQCRHSTLPAARPDRFEAELAAAGHDAKSLATVNPLA
jgi:hypothetical protein